MYINRIKENFTKDTRIMVVQSLVLSILNYGIMIWGATSQTQLHRAQKMQNFAAKVALGGAKYDHVTPYLRELKWLKVEEKYKYELALNIHKLVNKKLPAWLLPLPTLKEKRHFNTRQQHLLHIPNTRTSMAQRSTVIAGPNLWNTLPHKIVNNNSITSFKKELKDYLLNSRF